VIALRTLAFSTCVLVLGCSDEDDGPSNFEARPLDCAAHPSALVCNSFDEVGQETAPFGFAIYQGEGTTVADGHGLALQFDRTGGRVADNGPMGPSGGVLIQFDLKTSTGANNTIMSVVLSPALMIEFIMTTNALGKVLRLRVHGFTEPQPPDVLDLVPDATLALDEWDRVQLRGTLSGGQFRLEYVYGPRDVAPRGPMMKTVAAADVELGTWSVQLEYLPQNAMPDTVLIDNVLLDAA
jgi:hypothetical protein